MSFIKSINTVKAGGSPEVHLLALKENISTSLFFIFKNNMFYSDFWTFQKCS